MVTEADVLSRLDSIGVTDADNKDVVFALCKTVHALEADLGRSLPPKLREVAIDRACGEYLDKKVSSGMFTGSEASAVVESIKEGDTTVAFDTKTAPSEQVKAYAARLQKSGSELLGRFRRVVW